MSPQLERGDKVRFEYRASSHENGVYEGHVVGIGEKRITIRSGKNMAYISDADQILYIIKKNDPKVIHSLSEAFRLNGGLGTGPIEEL